MTTTDPAFCALISLLSTREMFPVFSTSLIPHARLKTGLEEPQPGYQSVGTSCYYSALANSVLVW